MSASGLFVERTRAMSLSQIVAVVNGGENK
jgi:hypothetical protein